MLRSPKSCSVSPYLTSTFAVACGLALSLSAQSARSEPTEGKTANASVGAAAVALRSENPVKGLIATRQTHHYTLALDKDQYVRIAARQLTVDVGLRMLSREGATLAEADAFRGIEGTEIVSLVAEVAGIYRVEVRCVEKTQALGEYELTVRDLRAATAADRERVAAERAKFRADRLYGQGKPDALKQALQEYDAALQHSRAAEDPAGEANSLNGAALALRLLGNQKEAMKNLTEAVPLWEKARDDAGLSKTLNNLGFLSLSQGNHQKALDYYNQALNVAKASKNRSAQADALNNIGGLYRGLGDQSKAIDFYNQSLSIRRDLRQHSLVAHLLGNLGTDYSDLAEYQRAFETYDEALSIASLLKDSGAETHILINLGTLYSKLGDHKRALKYFDRAVEESRGSGNRTAEANALNNRGVVHSILGEHQKALEDHQASMSLAAAMGDEALQVRGLANVGYAYFVLGEKDKALDHYTQFLARVRKSGDRPGEAAALYLIAATDEARGESDRALELYQETLPIAREVGDRAREAASLHKIARIQRDKGNLPEARAKVEAVLALAESQRTKVLRPDLRASYFASVKPYYDLYIDVLMRLHQMDPDKGLDVLALGASERSRARVLLETLSESRADIRQGADPDLLDRERELRRQLESKTERRAQLLGRKNAGPQAASLATEIENLQGALEEVEAQLRAKSPRYAALTQPASLGLAEIQRLLDPETMLLEYSLGPDRSYLWAVSTSGLATYELPAAPQIESAARKLYQLLTARQVLDATSSKKRQTPGELDRAYLEQAEALSATILGPVAAQLGHQRLIIVAAGALQYVPFAALPVPGLRSPRGVWTPLMIDHEILSLPSMSVLAELRAEIADRKPRQSKALAVLADPVFSADDQRVRKKAVRKSGQVEPAAPQFVRATRDLTDDSGQVSRLPFTRREAQRISGFATDATVSLDFQANRATAMNPELGNHRIVHFATHGILNSENPELSGIVLSLVDAEGKAQNGFLGLRDLYNLKLPADLVVLSACQTGLGRDVKGEGLVGLTRGFMYAGAARIVASLWKVNDVATSELMARFYESMLAKGLEPAQALRSAQKSMWQSKRWHSPYYWAAFLIQGEWRKTSSNISANEPHPL